MSIDGPTQKQEAIAEPPSPNYCWSATAPAADVCCVDL